MRSLGILGALASAAMAPALAGSHHKGSTRYPTGHRPRGYYWRGDKAERSTARRLRQMERDRRNQEARAIKRLGTHAFVATYQDGKGLDADTIRISRRGRIIT